MGSQSGRKGANGSSREKSAMLAEQPPVQCTATYNSAPAETPACEGEEQWLCACVRKALG